MSDRKLKIVVSGRDVIGTGGGTVLLETVKQFKALGHEVVLVVDYSLPDIDGVIVNVTPFGDFLKSWEPSGKIGFRIKHFLQLFLFSFFGRIAVSKFERMGFVSIDHNGEAFGGDIVVLHNVFIEQFYADRRSKLRKVPQFFNPTFSFRILRERLILASKKTKLVIAVSDQTVIEAKPLIRSATPVVVIESGINSTKFKPLNEAARQSRRLAEGLDGKFLTLFVGHEFERKRLDLVMRAMTLLPNEHVLWVIGGRMSKVDDYIDLSLKLRLQGRIKFLGTLSDAERYFEIADVFVLPSNYETWGLVALEAMACGVPVIMTPVGCAKKVIIDGETGYVVNYDHNEIADKLNLLAADIGNHALMRKSARLKAEEHSWSSVAKLYIDQIETISKQKLNG